MSVPRQDKIRALLAAAPVVPVITIEHAPDAVPLARALLAGGIAAIEITLRTAAAPEAARRIAAEVPEAVLGIGTVLSVADYKLAQGLGARFALSPGVTPSLIEAAAETNFPFVPGIATASELMAALECGFDVVKFFPAETMGGIKGLKALAAPFPAARFCPTGGISEANAGEWLKEKAVLAVGGSWIAPPDLIRAQDWAEITRRAKAASALR
jgi:2-dehydro-3-deoxyphosphogluconate aldolase / (4S)-4-hydroxy-2-oxoglutarate aldolase